MLQFELLTSNGSQRVWASTESSSATISTSTTWHFSQLWRLPMMQTMHCCSATTLFRPRTPMCTPCPPQERRLWNVSRRATSTGKPCPDLWTNRPLPHPAATRNGWFPVRCKFCTPHPKTFETFENFRKTWQHTLCKTFDGTSKDFQNNNRSFQWNFEKLSKVWQNYPKTLEITKMALHWLNRHKKGFWKNKS